VVPDRGDLLQKTGGPFVLLDPPRKCIYIYFEYGTASEIGRSQA
jgi:hypothetical protein